MSRVTIIKEAVASVYNFPENSPLNNASPQQAEQFFKDHPEMAIQIIDVFKEMYPAPEFSAQDIPPEDRELFMEAWDIWQEQ